MIQNVFSYIKQLFRPKYDGKYLLQGHDYCCSIYALCNALRFYGKSSPGPGTKEWKKLVKIAKCEYGPALCVREAADYLGLVLENIDPDDCIKKAPAVLTVFNTNPVGCHLHAVLVIGGENGYAKLVNLRYIVGPVVEDVLWKDLSMPLKDNINYNAFTVRLK